MKIMVLGPPNMVLTSIIKSDGHQFIQSESPVSVHLLRENEVDFIVSYGYRCIITSEVLNHMKNRIINMHISYLPWNRGADPNLWSFLEDTPKGVTIHYMDEGIDTGDIIVQKEIIFEDDKETLATTYQKLQEEILKLFATQWPLIRDGKFRRQKQTGKGTFHNSSDKNKYEHLLTNGWNTPVSTLAGKGKLFSE